MNVSLLPSALLCSVLLSSASACGDDSEAAVDAMPAAIDASSVPSDGAGIVCPNAMASYTGTIFEPSATDDGNYLTFRGQLDISGGADRLLLQVASGAPPTGSLSLPDANWTVSICVSDEDDTCADELVAYSGTLQITKAEDRLQASVTETLFVDSLTTPTCSAALSQSTIDVAIDGPL